MAREHAILTAASPAYAESLLALVGSLNCNWPGHPPVLVYDLGLDPGTVRELDGSGIMVRKVPAFCPHWRKHFTWKIWACHDAPCDSYLWLDAGICVLAPMPEAFVQMEAMGYFVVPNGLALKEHMTPGLKKNMGLDDKALAHALSLTGGVHGLRKTGQGLALIAEALNYALVEENLAATGPRQFHDQTLLSILMHKYFSPIVWADRMLYGADQGYSPQSGQRIWCHRGAMQRGELDYFRACLREQRPSRRAAPPRVPSAAMRLRIRIAKWRGRYPVQDAAPCIYDGVREAAPH